jgi:CBS domain-containing protein
MAATAPLLNVVVPESTTSALSAAGVPVSALFHRVGSVIPEGQELLYARPDDPVQDVLELMASHGYSQIPLRAVPGAEIRGVFSYRSFAQHAIPRQKMRGGIVALPVEAFAEQPKPFIDPSQELTEIFDVLDAKEFALVGTPRDVLALVTATDVLRWLYALSEPFVLFGEIERALRQLVDHRLSASVITECARRAFGHLYKGRSEPLPTQLHDMSLDELRLLVINGDNWQCLGGVLGPNREWAASQLGGLPNLRNDVFHFRRDLDQEELEQIVQARIWLLGRVAGLPPRLGSEL